ncbi:hypothetical protein VN12_23395 [Pirellula sp. SH-Sr6A]|nr:hypothetical protein VN12_23395 [Pirellula sp. SH-Sr6A]
MTGLQPAIRKPVGDGVEKGFGVRSSSYVSLAEEKLVESDRFGVNRFGSWIKKVPLREPKNLSVKRNKREEHHDEEKHQDKCSLCQCLPQISTLVVAHPWFFLSLRITSISHSALLGCHCSAHPPELAGVSNGGCLGG